MKFDRGFPLQVAITFIAGLGTAVLALSMFGSQEMTFAVILGALLSTVNVMGGYFAIEFSLGKSQETFLKAVLGGMGIRMLFLLGILALLIKFADIHAVALVVSVLSFYIVYLVLEIFYIQKRLSHSN